MPKKSLGQNFLNDDDTLNKIADCGEISDNDVILEIGPGTGNLTKKLLDRNPKNLIVVEKDRNLTILLKEKFGNKVQIINDDILDCYNKFSTCKQLKIFGNLPYNISTQILISFIKIEQLKKKIKKFVFVFQKEVADRILANENSKEYGRISIITSWKMNSHKIFDIHPKFFFPKPKVWSTVITLTPKSNFENLKKVKNLEHVTTIFFNQRRKMIKKPMKQLFKNFEEIAKDLDLDLNLRPQNLSTKKYLEICKIYEKLNQ